MSENVVEFVQALGEAGVAARSDLKSFMRADEIADVDMGALVDAGASFTAQVVGTDVWVVRFELVIDEGAAVAERLNVWCTCPVPREWCKHAVAVARRMMRDPEWVRQAKKMEELEEDDAPTTKADADVTVRDVVDSTLGIMRKRELITVINTLREKKPMVEPAVTKLVMPYSSVHPEGLVAVQEAIEHTRVLFESAFMDADVDAAASQLRYTGNVIRSHADDGREMQLLVALETLMFEASERAQLIALPVGSIVQALEELYLHHVAIAHWLKLDADRVIDWLLNTYFAPGGYLPTKVDEYADLLGSEGLDRLIKEAHKCRPLHPKKLLPLEIDVALIRNNMHELKRLCEQYGNYDALLSFYQRNGMDVGAEKLVTDALSANDPTVLSPEVLYEAAAKYFGDDGMRMYHRYWFFAAPSLEYFLDFIRAPGVDFAEAVFVLQSVEDVATNPDYTLLAATWFERFDVGFDVITTGGPSARMAADFASAVGMKYDPVWAMGMIFVHIRQQLSRSVVRGSVAVQRASLVRIMERIVMLRKTVEKAAGSEDVRIDWEAEVRALKTEFGSHPVVRAAFEEWGL